MDEKKPLQSAPHETAGQQFVKSIRPIGCALFLILGILVTVLLFTVGSDPIPGYEPPQTMEYYAENLDELMRELEDAVFPALPEEYGLTARIGDGAVVVTVDGEHYAKARAAVMHYFTPDIVTVEAR